MKVICGAAYSQQRLAGVTLGRLRADGRTDDASMNAREREDVLEACRRHVCTRGIDLICQAASLSL